MSVTPYKTGNKRREDQRRGSVTFGDERRRTLNWLKSNWKRSPFSMTLQLCFPRRWQSSLDYFVQTCLWSTPLSSIDIRVQSWLDDEGHTKLLNLLERFVRTWEDRWSLRLHAQTESLSSTSHQQIVCDMSCPCTVSNLTPLFRWEGTLCPSSMLSYSVVAVSLISFLIPFPFQDLLVHSLCFTSSLCLNCLSSCSRSSLFSEKGSLPSK